METQAPGFIAKNVSRHHVFEVEAPRALVFPLLCPVREREWLPGWQADIVHSTSGLVEEGCIFRSQAEEPSAPSPSPRAR